jgi:hypothetical protein
MENRTVGSIATQAKDMAAFCTQAVKGKAQRRDSATGVLSAVASALLRPCCNGPADWGKCR